MQYHPYVIGIGGGTSSGKTTVAKAIVEKLGEKNISYLSYDNYYRDLSHLDLSERAKTNFDHPSSLDTPLLISDLRDLLSGNDIESPIYDFISHTRKSETYTISPKKVILIEGILTLHHFELQKLMDIKIFVDTEADERLIRRLERDLKSRGRSYDEIIKQYQETVKPMHLQFIEPSKINADIIIPSGYNPAAVELVIDGLRKKCSLNEIGYNLCDSHQLKL